MRPHRHKAPQAVAEEIGEVSSAAAVSSRRVAGWDGHRGAALQGEVPTSVVADRGFAGGESAEDRAPEEHGTRVRSSQGARTDSSGCGAGCRQPARGLIDPGRCQFVCMWNLIGWRCTPGFDSSVCGEKKGMPLHRGRPRCRGMPRHRGMPLDFMGTQRFHGHVNNN